MNKLKQHFFAIIAFLSAIIGGLLYFLSESKRKNQSLQAEKDLTVQREKSKIVDGKVESAQKEIDELEKQMGEKPKDDDEFWGGYTK